MSWLREDELADVDVLSADDCWAMLEKAPLGRLATRDGEGIDIFPINFTVRDREIYFRSAPGSKLVDITRASAVAFEIDGQHRRTHWSVVVHGTAARLGSDDEIHASGISLLAAWHPGDKFNYVRVSATSITGRSFAASRD